MPRVCRVILAGGFLVLLAFLGFVFVRGGFGDKRVEGFAQARNGLVLFAHRGVVTLESLENTASAVALAREKSFPGIEVDIQVSCDGQVFLFHDSDGDRLLRSPVVVRDKTLAELQGMPLFDGDRPVTARIMSGDELMVHKNDFVFYFDVKRCWIKDPFRAARLIRDFIYKHDIRDRVVVGCVDVAFTLYLKHLDPGLKTCLERSLLLDPVFFRLIPRKFRPDFICCSSKRLTPEMLMRLSHDPHLQRLIVWGINSTELENLMKRGVRNFIVDYEPCFNAFVAPTR